MITYVPPRSRYDGFYQLHDLIDNPKAPFNKYYARYHGLQSIAIDRLE